MDLKLKQRRKHVQTDMVEPTSAVLVNLRERMPDTSALRARVMDAVEDALDRVEDAMADAPRPKEVATKAKSSRAGELAMAAVTAGLPIVTSALKSRGTRTAAKRAARMAPMVAVRAHPVLLGLSLVGGAALGVAALRRLRAPGGEGAAELEAAHTRDAHYELSGDADVSPSLDDDLMGGTAAPTRRFARASDVNGTSSGAH